MIQMAMTSLEIDTVLQDQIWAILSGILHLGNVSFKAEGDGCSVKNRDGKSSLLPFITWLTVLEVTYKVRRRG